MVLFAVYLFATVARNCFIKFSMSWVNVAAKPWAYLLKGILTSHCFPSTRWVKKELSVIISWVIFKNPWLSPLLVLIKSHCSLSLLGKLLPISKTEDKHMSYWQQQRVSPSWWLLRDKSYPFFHSLPEIKFFLKIGAQLSCWELTSDNLKMSLKQIDLDRCTEAASSGGGGGAASTSRVGWPRRSPCTRGSTAARSTWEQIHVHTRVHCHPEHPPAESTVRCASPWGGDGSLQKALATAGIVRPWNKPAQVAWYCLILT